MPRSELVLECGCRDIVTENAIGFVQYWVPCDEHMEPPKGVKIVPGTVPH